MVGSRKVKNLVARRLSSRNECLKERERYIIKWLGGSPVALTDEPPSRSRDFFKQTDELPSYSIDTSLKNGPVFCSLANFVENYRRLLPCSIYRL